MTPDYNDGEWHGWSGKREMPVHPDSVIEVVWHDPRQNSAGKDIQTCGVTAWGHALKFRVITPYIETPKPREFWAYGGAIYDNFNDAVWAKVHDGVKRRDMHSPREPIIHLREVTE